MPKPPITTFSSLNLNNRNPNFKDLGLYAPELTQTEINEIPAGTLRNGAIVYNKDADLFQLYERNNWKQINTSGGDVNGPNVSVVNNIAIFNNIDGTEIADSGVAITNVPALLFYNPFKNQKLKAPLITVNEISNIGQIKFTNGLGLVFVDDLMPVEFITNDVGLESQVCSLFTGGLPSASSSPSALVELKTDIGALLLSRLTQTEINNLTLPVNGMIVYNSTSNKFSIKNPLGWVSLFATNASGNLDLENGRIVNLSTPLASTDGANKAYVDSTAAGIATSVTLTGGVTGSGSTGLPITTTVASVSPSAITGYPSTNTSFLRGDGTWTNVLGGNLIINGNIGIGTSSPNAQLQLSNVAGNRKIVLWDSVNTDHNFWGFGVNPDTFALRYQTPNPFVSHVFYSGFTDGTNSNELFRITGTGFVGIGTSSPNVPLQFANTLANRKIVLLQNADNDHQVTAIGTNTNIFRLQVPTTTTDFVFYAGTSTTTSNELVRVKGTGGLDLLNNKIVNLATPTLGTDAANKTYVDSTTSNVANARYIIQTSNVSLPNAQVLGSLTTGLLKNTATTGVLTIGVVGTDYYAPGSPTFFIDTNGSTNNFFAGTGTGTATTTGFQNVAVGINTLSTSTTGSANVVLGWRALFSNTTGSTNVALGWRSLEGNTIGSDNVSLGAGALLINISGTNNVAAGSLALSNNANGNNNIAIGSSSLSSVIGGTNNVGIGAMAGSACVSSTNCIFIGALADASVNNLTNAIAIGADAIVSASNSIVLGNGCNVGIGISAPNAPLQFGNTGANRKIVLFDQFNNDFQFYGFGINNSTLRYSIQGVNQSHVFFAGVNTVSASELMRITGTGFVGIGTSSPNVPLQFANTLANRKIVLLENANNDHQVIGLGTNTNIFRLQVPTTTTDFVFYAGTSTTTSNELVRVKGTGGLDLLNNKIVNLATPTLGTDAANKTYVDSTTSNVANARYIIQTSNVSLPNAQVLGSLTTGLLKNTATTGVLTIGVVGTDYYAPGSPTFFIDTNGSTNNFFAGTGTGTATTTGFQNVAVGINTLSTSTTGSANVVLGWRALFSNTTGSTNVALGWRSLEGNTIGSDNVSLGAGALLINISGTNNVAAGSLALSNNANGNNNIAIGSSSLSSVIGGTNNVGIGAMAGSACVSSTNCIFIGALADASVNNLTNAIAIGADAIVSASNSIVLGNGCNVGIGISAPNAPLQFGNTGANRKIVLFDQFNNDFQFYGFGINNSTLRYSIQGVNQSHVFFAGVNTVSASELMRITGTGFVGIGTSSPNVPLQFANTLANRKIVLLENANNDHQVIGLGTNTNIFRLQVPATTTDFVFYAGTSTTTSNEVGRLSGTGNLTVSGTLFGNRPRALIYFNGISSMAVTANTPAKMTNVTTSIGFINSFSAPISNRLVYTGTATMIVNVRCSASLNNATALSVATTLSIYKNGVLITGSSVSNNTASSSISYTLTTETLVSMNTNDYVEAYVTCGSSITLNIYSLILSTSAA